MPKVNENCAECGSRTDYTRNGKKIKNRRRISSEKLKKYFFAKKIDLKKFKYVCHKCYSNLNQVLCNTTILDQINKLSGLQIKEKNTFSEKNRIVFNDSRCHSLTGLNSEQFKTLLNLLEWNFLFSITKSDSLFLYLARLRLGKFNSKVIK